MRRVSIFLTVATLIVGMSGCFTPFRMQYQVRISSTEGGRVATPGEGIFTYWEGTAVDLVAQAEDGCHFANWTGNVSTISNVTSATTSITMNCDYSIMANFAEDALSLGHVSLAPVAAMRLSESRQVFLAAFMSQASPTTDF